MSARTRPSTQPEIGEFRRQNLIEGTLRSLATNGIAGTSVRTITAAAGVSHGLARHYFPTKDELLAAAFRYLCDGISEQIRDVERQGDRSARERLKATPRAVFSPPAFNVVNRLAFLEFWHEIRQNQAIRDIQRDLYARYRRRVARLFGEAARDAGVEIDHRAAAIGLIALLDGLWLELSLDDRSISRDQAMRVSDLYIDQQLNSATNRE
jgi:TetR/AcrR family transcriptional repressor of bet genes